MSLAQQSVLVTRAAQDSEGLVAMLRAQGATVYQVPTIVIRPVPQGVERGIQALADADWVVFTSAHGVEALQAGLRHVGQTWPFAGKVGVIGPATAQAAAGAGWPVAFMPSTYTTKAMAEQLPSVNGRKVILLRARRGNPLLAEDLRRRGANVTDVAAYDTLARPNLAQAVAPFCTGALDWVTFASPSTVEALDEALPPSRAEDFRSKVRAGCIGPVTAAAATGRGFRVGAEARPHTVEALVQAMVEASLNV
jgi:uroporphyrinogen III methyltransferase / synthase